MLELTLKVNDSCHKTNSVPEEKKNLKKSKQIFKEH